MKTYEIIGKHVPCKLLQGRLKGLSKWIVYLILNSASFVFPDESLDFMNIEEGCVYELTHIYLLSLFLWDSFFLQKCFIHPSNPHQVVILIPYNNRVFIFAHFLGLTGFIDDGIGEGDAAACVLNEIIFHKMRPWKNRCLFVKKRRSGKVHERPEKAIGKFTVVTVHMLGIEKNKPHVKVVIFVLEVHSAIALYLDMRKMIRSKFRFFRPFK